MKNLKYLVIVALVCSSQIITAQTKKSVKPFNKVIISPHIETTFVQGDEESVKILSSTEPMDKINIEVNGGTLRVYLDDAKETTKHKKVVINGMKQRVPIYKDKVLTILVTYKNIDALSLRGEQQTVCESLIDIEKFKLKIYGESQVIFNAVSFNELDANVYGESYLTIKKGSIDNQKITAYGESKINLVEVDNKTSKLKAYGEAQFTVKSSERIKFSAYGEAQLYYKGTAEVDRGISIGDSKINRIN